MDKKDTSESTILIRMGGDFNSHKSRKEHGKMLNTIWKGFEENKPQGQAIVKDKRDHR